MVSKRVYIERLSPDLDGKSFVIAGWAQEVRDLKKIKFILLRDRTDSVQCVLLPDETDKESLKAISDVTKESVVEIQGVVKKSKQAKKGFEVVPVYDGHMLKYGNKVEGPAIIEQVNTTTFITPEYNVLCDKFGSYTMYRKEKESEIKQKLGIR